MDKCPRASMWPLHMINAHDSLQQIYSFRDKLPQASGWMADHRARSSKSSRSTALQGMTSDAWTAAKSKELPAELRGREPQRHPSQAIQDSSRTRPLPVYSYPIIQGAGPWESYENGEPRAFTPYRPGTLGGSSPSSTSSSKDNRLVTVGQVGGKQEKKSGSKKKQQKMQTKVAQPTQTEYGDIAIFPRRKAGQSGMGSNRPPVVVTREVLESHFNMPLLAVCKKLGLCATVLKKVCRQLGVHKWPYKETKLTARRQGRLLSNGMIASSPVDRPKEEAEKAITPKKEEHAPAVGSAAVRKELYSPVALRPAVQQRPVRTVVKTLDSVEPRHSWSETDKARGIWMSSQHEDMSELNVEPGDADLELWQEVEGGAEGQGGGQEAAAMSSNAGVPVSGEAIGGDAQLEMLMGDGGCDDMRWLFAEPPSSCLPDARELESSLLGPLQAFPTDSN
ncbi:hypothetical protein GUITHDRAFT_108477 [Guillardia theta CCMP2712]|uniref:RWP-RK domain-containing protein n=2 Tax=Guillardia theta TaxID=55529 RepID=L1JAN2_GUITC|nr:hypothetical protein GUITHDRAFT_108477 [Guillardia theta CCMP2712]EKX45603.1 hypothetical protein GUITHDRAFT_108477 [Guillardia theta CCMP2712]|eukprot:XP_005832583.1 hypothetical protein GUITHDRAFT_108477 [Guillardia theta CCMP2712]